MKIDATITVRDLIERYPSVIAVFLKRRLTCVGCPAEAFHTLEEVALVYGLALQPFLRELRDASEKKND
jgi:hybrid cluster-associated redox disulfide protein